MVILIWQSRKVHQATCRFSPAELIAVGAWHSAEEHWDTPRLMTKCQALTAVWGQFDWRFYLRARSINIWGSTVTTPAIALSFGKSVRAAAISPDWARTQAAWGA